MNAKLDPKVRMIPIDRINIVNPRERGSKKFSQIVGNIGRLGLKKPITVTLAGGSNGDARFDLVLALDAFDQTVDESNVPEQQSRLDGMNRVAAHHLLWPHQLDGVQLGGAGEQGFAGDFESGTNHSAHVFAPLGDVVEHGRRAAEVHDDRGVMRAFVGGDGVDDGGRALGL